MPGSELADTTISSMPVHLRGHHFLCILTYRGLGYTPAFVATMSDIVARIEDGAPIILKHGPDDICAGLTAECRRHCDHDCTRPDTIDIDHLALAAVEGVIGDVSNGPVALDAGRVAQLRAAFSTGAIRAACSRCPWSDLCDQIAAEGFAETRLHPPSA